VRDPPADPVIAHGTPFTIEIRHSPNSLVTCSTPVLLERPSASSPRANDTALGNDSTPKNYGEPISTATFRQAESINLRKTKLDWSAQCNRGLLLSPGLARA
jgi:hypothetical protein